MFNHITATPTSDTQSDALEYQDYLQTLTYDELKAELGDPNDWIILDETNVPF